jgi:hypothetical protein
MKKVKLLTIVFISIVFSECTTHVKTGDGSNKIETDGEIITETRKIGDFNQIEIDGVFNVILSQGESTGLKLETKRSVADHIISKMYDGKLILKMEDDTDFGDIEPVKIYVQVRDLKSLSTKGVGKIKTEQALKLDQFKLNCKGVGAINLKLSANMLVVQSETVGAITLAGKVTEADITHNGVGVLQAFELLTQNLKLSSNGVGAAEVYASESIAIEAKGLGSVQYKGNPETKNIISEGIGKVSSVD